MKNFFLLLIALAPFLQAQKIVTVDMNQVFENYYRTLIENKKLAKQKDITESRLKEMNDQVYKLQNDYQALMRESMNPALTEDARMRKKSEAETKASEGQTSIKNLKFFQKSLQEEAVKKRRSITEELTAEIEAAITKHAEANKIDFIIDESGKSINGVKTLLYSTKGSSITESILAKINKGHEDFVKKELAKKELLPEAKK